MKMINTWFTSDTHFGHSNILEFEKKARPFKTLEEMHEVMIERWNSVVGSKDIIYHLGDFCFGKSNIDIAARLNGKKRLVMGNHDNYPISDYLRHFEKIIGVTFWKGCILSHVPVHPDTLTSRAFLNVHGHLHSKNIMWNNTAIIREEETGIIIIPPQYNENYFNVSVEKNNLTPFHADEILAKLKKINL